MNACYIGDDVCMDIRRFFGDGSTDQRPLVTNPDGEIPKTFDLLRGGFVRADAHRNGALAERHFVEYLRRVQKQCRLLRGLSDNDYHAAFDAFAGEDKLVDKSEWNSFLDVLEQRTSIATSGAAERDCCLKSLMTATMYSACLGSTCVESRLETVVTHEFKTCVAQRKEDGPQKKEANQRQSERLSQRLSQFEKEAAKSERLSRRLSQLEKEAGKLVEHV